MDLTRAFADVTARVKAWEASWGDYAPHPAAEVAPERLQAAMDEYMGRLQGNYPFFHPRYAGQMLKPPHPAAVTGYLAAMLINPNNHALDGGPPTGQMEKEVVRDLAALFGLPDDTLGHLTGGGTVANLEALWVARHLHPDRAVAFSEEAHYTHGRMGEVLGLETLSVPADEQGCLRLDALEDLLRTGRVGTVVLTTGTTALGAVDPVADALPLCRRYGARVHIDAAYGGFFTLLAGDDAPDLLSADVRRHLRAVADCDSVAIDPHKHGLQPYGCGCILFRDPSVGRFYRHDSPYTYFTSDALHLGEISLECSRPGAAAGALWFTLRLLPLAADAGLGLLLAASLRAARRWHGLLAESEPFVPYTPPQLDIVTFFPRPGVATAAAVDEASARLFRRAMDGPEPVFLSLLRVSQAGLQRALPGLAPDAPHARILRSVLMKPEHEAYVDTLHTRLLALAAAARVQETP